MTELSLKDGTKALGVETETESYVKSDASGGNSGRTSTRSQLKVANRDITGSDFQWIDHGDINSRTNPADAIAIEREENGDFYGYLKEVRIGDERPTAGGLGWATLQVKLPAARKIEAHRRKVEKEEIGELNNLMREAQIDIKRAQRRLSPADAEKRIAAIHEQLAGMNKQFESLKAAAQKLKEEENRFVAVLTTVDGKEKEIPLAMIVRAWKPNTMDFAQKCAFYAGKMWEFVWGEPREANTEGGIFPAIFGTVLMTILMSAAVTPFGVLAALYLREYAKQGPLVRAVRIAVNNLAGVPSIVFGVFGLGFFIYLVGGSIDRIFYPELLPSPTFGTGGILWASLTLALLTVPVVIVATEESIAAVPRGAKEGSLALGASKFQTLCRIVLPASLPGILTGQIGRAHV